MNTGITFTIGGKSVRECNFSHNFSQRLSTIANVKDYRLEQLDQVSYRIMILPKSNVDTRGIKGSVLDACVDTYGIKGRFDIDIITEDNEFLPKLDDNTERMRNYLYDSCV